VRSYVLGFDPADPTNEILYQRTVYGESHPDSNSSGGAAASLSLNLRGKTYLVADMAGVLISDRFDFTGNLTNAHRRLASSYKRAPDWSSVEARFAATLLDPTALDAALGALADTETFATSTSYDALNRPTAMTTPDLSVTLPEYNEANLLERISVKLRGAATATAFVTDLDYDAKGQRALIAYGNGTSTTYAYDPLTFRLIHMQTTRPAGTDGLVQQIFATSDTVQNLSYTYDPAGNLTRIADDALKLVVYAGQTVEPAGEYTYDALYRLIEAKGREHIAQSAFLSSPDGNYRDHPFVGSRDQNDLAALRNYTESYAYDAVGNITSVTHAPAGGNNWTRTYAYGEPSQLETGVKSNRLTSTTIGAGGPNPLVESYAHDGHGNMVAMPHLSMMQWDFMDRLSATSRQVVNNATTPAAKIPETTYYVYDAAGQRVRKVNENQLGTKKNERLYLGGCEFYREYGAGAVQLERQSQHVMDDKQRVALVETLTIDNGNTVANPLPVQRYQLANHLGSASLELDENAGLITYEEYTPYGNPAFQGGRTAAEVSLKRYRYTGMERDEENGFSYHTARYYAPWLGRWTSCDSNSPRSGLNCYLAMSANPLHFVDPGGRDDTRVIPVTTVGDDFQIRGFEKTSNPFTGGDLLAKSGSSPSGTAYMENRFGSTMRGWTFLGSKNEITTTGDLKGARLLDLWRGLELRKMNREQAIKAFEVSFSHKGTVAAVQSGGRGAFLGSWGGQHLRAAFAVAGLRIDEESLTVTRGIGGHVEASGKLVPITPPDSGGPPQVPPPPAPPAPKDSPPAPAPVKTTTSSPATGFIGSAYRAAGEAAFRLLPGAVEASATGQGIAMVTSRFSLATGAEMMVGASMQAPIAAATVAGAVEGPEGKAWAKAHGFGSTASEGIGLGTAMFTGGLTAVDVAIGAAIIAGATISMPALVGVAIAGGIAGGISYLMTQ
jgi:RHS repeat-associated protein